MLNVLYFWWLKGKHMVAMIGDETLKNTFNENTYIHGRNAPKSKEIFTKKISNCKKKNENRLLLSY